MGIQKLEVLVGATSTSSPIWNSPFNVKSSLVHRTRPPNLGTVTMKLIVFSALLAMALAMPEPGYEAAPKGDARRYWGKRSAEEPGYEVAPKGDASHYFGKRSADSGPPGIIGKRSSDSEEPG